ncbi:MAG TPA: hypothetical protein VGK29_20315 [Paludibaculum sp.]|jgi:hypothetical protein
MAQTIEGTLLIGRIEENAVWLVMGEEGGPALAAWAGFESTEELESRLLRQARVELFGPEAISGNQHSSETLRVHGDPRSNSDAIRESAY